MMRQYFITPTKPRERVSQVRNDTPTERSESRNTETEEAELHASASEGELCKPKIPITQEIEINIVCLTFCCENIYYLIHNIPIHLFAESRSRLCFGSQIPRLHSKHTDEL